MKTKRLLISLLLTLVLVFPLIPSVGAVYILGDVDGDGHVTAADARLALRRAVLLENYAVGSDAFGAADVDFDGQVTASDARMILRAAVGLEALDVPQGLTDPEDPEGAYTVERTDAYAVFLDGWTWNNDNPHFVTVDFILMNYTGKTIYFSLYGWGVNSVMIPDSGESFKGTTVVSPHSRQNYTVYLEDVQTPSDFSIAPTGAVSFTVGVYDGPERNPNLNYYYGGSEHQIYDTGLTEYMYYEPYGFEYDSSEEGLFDFGFWGWEQSASDTTYDTNDYYFLYRNRSEETQQVMLTLNKINDVEVPAEYNFGDYFIVYANHSCLLDLRLFTGSVSDPGVLRAMGIAPGDVKTVNYDLAVFDADFNYLHVSSWTLS
ncbi:MAG: dockerin type I repeat-containing protein [Clostridia bacterium]|nr:dockerin type I repeat-containing protein [Clostridia bacterium]